MECEKRRVAFGDSYLLLFCFLEKQLLVTHWTNCQKAGTTRASCFLILQYRFFKNEESVASSSTRHASCRGRCKNKKGHLKYGGKRMCRTTLSSRRGLITDKNMTSKLCMLCFVEMRLAPVTVDGKSVKSHIAVECINPCRDSFKARYSRRALHSNLTLADMGRVSFEPLNYPNCTSRSYKPN